MSVSSNLKVVLRQAGAYAEKELNQQLRFKVDFFATTFVPALINLGLFGTIFFGFFKTGATGIRELNNSNFVAFALLGSLVATLFNTGFGAFQGRFLHEKYWQTAIGILASPLSPWALLLGVALAETVQFSVVVLAFLGIAYFFFPVGIVAFVGSVLLLILLYIVISGFSLIRGVLFLVNENVDPVLNYFMVGTAYLSCFYYPVSFLPSFLQPLALINPLYFIVSSMRALWLGLPIQTTYLFVSALAAIVSPLLATYAFRKVWRNLDITGY